MSILWRSFYMIRTEVMLLNSFRACNIPRSFQPMNLTLLVTAIEVQLGRKIWGDRDHFKVITSDAEIVEIQRKKKTGKVILVIRQMISFNMNV